MPVVGTRAPVGKLAALADAGWDEDRILGAFPQQTRADVQAALSHESVRRSLSAQTGCRALVLHFLIDEDVVVLVAGELRPAHEVRFVVDVLGSGSKDPVIRRCLRACSDPTTSSS